MMTRILALVAGILLAAALLVATIIHVNTAFNRAVAACQLAGGSMLEVGTSGLSSTYLCVSEGHTQPYSKAEPRPLLPLW